MSIGPATAGIRFRRSIRNKRGTARHAAIGSNLRQQSFDLFDGVLDLPSSPRSLRSPANIGKLNADRLDVLDLHLQSSRREIHRTPFPGSAQGQAEMVTTRSVKVAFCGQGGFRILTLLPSRFILLNARHPSPSHPYNLDSCTQIVPVLQNEHCLFFGSIL